MTIKELEEFRMICEKGSLAKASKELFMSPQGLSRVLKNLESELECTLVNRMASGLELTECGECLFDYARIALEEYHKLKEHITEMQENADGAVELLLAYDVIRYLTPELLMDFQKENPGISFSYQELPDRIAERFLAEKKGNIAFSIGPFASECFEMKSLTKYKLGLLVYEEHPLAKKSEVTVNDLKGEKLFIENNSFKLNELVQSRCWNKGFEPKIVFETNGFDMCYNMCRQKKGVSVTIEPVHKDMKQDGLVMVPFVEKDMVWEIGILTLKDRVCEPAVRKFLEYVDKRLA